MLRFVTDNREFPVPFSVRRFHSRTIILFSSWSMGSSLPYVVSIPTYTLLALTLSTDIAWHMAAGMFMQVLSLPSKVAQFDIPRQIIDQCKA